MDRWTTFVLGHRKLVVLAWLALALFGAAASKSATENLTYDYSLPGEPGSEAAKLIDETFGNSGYVPPFLVTVSDPAGAVDTDAAGAIFRAAAHELGHVRVVDTAATGDRAFVTSDGHTAAALFFYHFDSHSTSQLTAQQVRTALDRAADPDLETGVTGLLALSSGSGSGGVGVLAEIVIGGLLALGVLLFVFGSAIAVLPLVVALASISASFALLWPMSELTDFSALVEFLIALVGLGVAIDYSLLIVARWREERSGGADNPVAVKTAMSTAGRSVAVSGVTVGIGLLSLLALPVPFLRTVGVGGALIPLASVAATLSLTPALLGGIGPRLEWPRRPAARRGARAWANLATAVIAHRRPVAILSTAVLAGLLVAAAHVNVGRANSESLATGGDAYDTLHLLDDGGLGSGYLSPIEAVVASTDAGSLAATLRDVPGIEAVFESREASSVRDNLTVLAVIPEHETVDSRSIDVVRRVRDVVRSAGFQTDSPGERNYVGITGTGPAALDFTHAVYGNFPLMLTIISLLVFVLLMIALRSIVLPLKAVVLNLVSLGATMGFLVLFWQRGIGSEALFGVAATGAVTFWLPVVVFAFLFGLSMDYEVFILTRIREEYDASGSTVAATVNGLANTGRLVTSAALIMFFAFAALAAAPGTELKVMATTLGFGILLDATLIRGLLLPALLAMFDRANWWLPQGLLTRLPMRGERQPVSSGTR